MKNSYSVIGLMSGTSLDGLDIAWCSFFYNNGTWSFEIKKAVTVEYPLELKINLSFAHMQMGEGLSELNVQLGRFFGESVNEFIDDLPDESFDLIASHGHTVFHQPLQGYTTQIGCPTTLAVETGVKVIADFRSLDVALGGQGAPLVPIGDQLLFSKYDVCLNLGGFANVSMMSNKERIAWDICPVNFVMNFYAQKKGLDYDKGGELAKKGIINMALLNALEKLDFYNKSAPKSLGREWVEEEVFPLINSFKLSVEDILATYSKHIALRIADDLKDIKGDVLVTGGGVFNAVLFTNMQKKAACSFVKPEVEIIDFKEALIFAFLGVLRDRNEINVLASVTGAKRDSSSGVVYDVLR